MTLMLGSTIGPYRIVERLGAGGMAAVYKGYQASLARHVAIKVLPEFFAQDEGFRERFRNEALAIAQLRHPNILAVYDYGEDQGLHYIVGEHVDGGTLAQLVGKPLALERVIELLGPVAAALDYAHQRGIVHRDVKPSNVLIAKDGTPILADFGLARMMGTLPRLTQTGTAIGTPEYMSPELAEGHPAEAASDQYALGVIAYEMLTGRVPFTAETPLAVLLAQAHQPLPLPRTIEPSVSELAESVLLKVLDKVPADRYASASAFIAALEQSARPAHHTSVVRRGKPSVVAVSPAARTHGSSWSRYRYPALAAGILALFGIVLGVRALVASDASLLTTLTPFAPVSSPGQSGAAGRSLADVLGTRLLHEVTLDAAGTEIQERFVCSVCSGEAVDPAHGQVRPIDGAVELTARSLNAGATAAVGFRQPSAARYVAEVVLRFDKSTESDAIWRVSLGDGSQHQITLNPTAETLHFEALTTSSAGVPEELTPRIPVSGMRAGRTFSLGYLIDGSRYALFVDGAEVARGNDPRLRHETPGLFFAVFAQGPEGSVTLWLEALRIYEAPKPGIALGPLVYEAKLEELLNDQDLATVVLSDKNAADARYADGAVHLSVSGTTNSGVVMRLSAAIPVAFIAELDLAFKSGSKGAQFSLFLGGGPHDTREIRIRPENEVMWLHYNDSDRGIDDQISGLIPVPGLQEGRPFTVAIRFERASYTLLLDDRLVAEGTREEFAQILPALEVQLFGDPRVNANATATVYGVRVYRVP